MTAAELLTVLTAVICCGALLNSLTPVLLWRRALAERPGHSTKPPALHQASARWHRINAELQMWAKAAGRARSLGHTAAALLSEVM